MIIIFNFHYWHSIYFNDIRVDGLDIGQGFCLYISNIIRGIQMCVYAFDLMFHHLNTNKCERSQIIPVSTIIKCEKKRNRRLPTEKKSARDAQKYSEKKSRNNHGQNLHCIA